MTGLKEMLISEKGRLSDIVRKTEKQLERAPEGTLRLSSCHNCSQFYHKYEGTSKNGVYLAKTNEELISGLAQKNYDEKVLKLAKRRLKQIETLEKEYQNDEIEQLFWKENAIRQSMIQPVEPTWEQLLEDWMAKEYRKKGFSEEEPYIVTEKGLRVRSKSEKMMAEYLDRYGIPYKYECPIWLKGVGYVHPDYTYFSKRKRGEVYHEHFGKMDDPVYANSAVRKIKDYQNNGIYLGERLIVTFETSKQVLNTRDFEEMLKQYVL